MAIYCGSRTPHINTLCGQSAEFLALNMVVKVKVKFTLEHAAKAPEGEQTYSCTASSTSALDVGGWSAPRPGRFTPGKDPVPVCEGGWVGPRAGLDG